jgi:hypothetical protein
MTEEIKMDLNTIEPCKLMWVAKFKDDTYLSQFNETQEEIKFEEVQNRFDDLKLFYLTNCVDICFVVNLEKGTIADNNYVIFSEDFLKEKLNTRLIYFRKHRHTISQDNKQAIKFERWYFLGLQWNDENGNNRKIVFKIDECGSFVVTGE